MFRLVSLGRLAVNAAPPGSVLTPLIVLLMGGALIAIIALIRAERFGVFEVIACGVFFFLLGGTGFGRSVYDFLSTLTGGG